jgi:hypothetical protein
MKTAFLIVALLFATQEAGAACAQKRSRDVSFIELAVPAGAKRPIGFEDFAFVNDETTMDELTAKVGPPDAAQGTRVAAFIWCFEDGTELMVSTRDRVYIDSVRHKGKEIFKRAKKKK